MLQEERAVPEVIRLPISRELAAVPRRHQMLPRPVHVASAAKAGYHEGATFFELEAFAEAVRGKRAVPVTRGIKFCERSELGKEAGRTPRPRVNSWCCPRTARDGKMAVLMGFSAALV